jgi:hypothetical protein
LRSQVEYKVGILHQPFKRAPVSDVSADEVDGAPDRSEIGRAAPAQVVKNGDRPVALENQPLYQMTANEARPPGHQYSRRLIVVGFAIWAAFLARFQALFSTSGWLQSRMLLYPGNKAANSSRWIGFISERGFHRQASDTLSLFQRAD